MRFWLGSGYRLNCGVYVSGLTLVAHPCMVTLWSRFFRDHSTYSFSLENCILIDLSPGQKMPFDPTRSSITNVPFSAEVRVSAPTQVKDGSWPSDMSQYVTLPITSPTFPPSISKPMRYVD